jgi:hypothetical protein
MPFVILSKYVREPENPVLQKPQPKLYPLDLTFDTWLLSFLLVLKKHPFKIPLDWFSGIEIKPTEVYFCRFYILSCLYY